MTLLEETLARIVPPDPAVARKTQALLDGKTKPRGSLGRLEELACRIAAARGAPVPELPVKAIVVMAADHGVAAEGVSAFPQEVTWQMVANFVRGGAAINVLARQAGAEVIVGGHGREAARGPPGRPPRARRRRDAEHRARARDDARAGRRGARGGHRDRRRARRDAA